MRGFLAMGVVAIAAVFAAGASGVSGTDTIRKIAGYNDLEAAGKARFQAGTLAVDGSGNVYFFGYSQRGNVRKLSSCGSSTKIAGTEKRGPSLGDGGPATSADVHFSEGIAADGQGNLYIAQRGVMVVRKVSPDGRITTFAGTAYLERSSGDGGPAAAASLSGPTDVAVDRQGNVYIAELSGRRVRKVNPAGTITTIAGTGGAGFSGDGGPATAAQLGVWSVAVDGRGNVYVAGEHRVRKVTPGGTITTIAGTGKQGFSGDGGPATKAQLNFLRAGVAADDRGNVYISDAGNKRVRKVSPEGTITTISGTGTPGFAGVGGPAAKAQLQGPADVAVDGDGNLYIADGTRILEISNAPRAAAGPTLSLGGASSQRLLAQKGVTVTAGCDRASSLTASGSVRILGTQHVFRLGAARSKLGTAGSRTLTLRFPAAEQRRFRRLLKPGQRAQATITVRAVDRAGHSCSATRVVAVRP